MQNPPEKTSLKRNLAVFLALAAAAALLFLLSRLLPSPSAPLPERAPGQAEAPGYVYIILNNRVWGIEALGEERNVTVDQGDGVINVIHLLPNGYYMESSTCDNQLCVTEGVVTLENRQRRFLGASVYCLPHNLQVELIVPSATRAPDAPDN